MYEVFEQLLSQEGLMFDGDPASPEAVDSILAAMQIGVEMAKKNIRLRNIFQILIRNRTRNEAKDIYNRTF